MAPYNVFQRFVVLMLAIHGQLEKCSDGRKSYDKNTTQFFKNLNVYDGIMQIEETIRGTKYTEDQLKILVRPEAPSDSP